MKRITALLVICIIVLSLSNVNAFAVENVSVYVNGSLLETDQGAIIYQDRTMVPLRAICEKLGCTVEWDDSTRTAIIQNEITMIATQINNYYMSKKDRRVEDGEQKAIPIDVAPILYNDRTLVPARAISEALNAKVEWVPDSSRVNITMEYDWIGDYENGYACVSKNGKVGYIDKKGEIIIPIEYYSKYSGSFTEYGVVILSNGSKCGIVNSKNQVVIPFDYDYICDPRWGWEESQAENADYTFLLQKNSLWGLADKFGNIVAYPQYDRIELFSENGLAAVRQGDYEGYINTDGDEVIPLIYEVARDFSEGLALVRYPREFDKYNDPPLFIGEKTYYGYINSRGDEVIPFQFDSATNFSEGLACVEVEGEWGIIDKRGRYIMRPWVVCDDVMEFQYGIAITERNTNVEDITYGFITADGYVSRNTYTDLFVDDTGYLIAAKNGRYGYIDSNENILVPFKYDQLDMAQNDLIPVMKNEKYGVVDMNGDIVIPLQYDSWVSFDDRYGKNCALTSIGDKVGIIDINNNIIAPFKFDHAREDEVLGTVLVDISQKAYYDLTGNRIE